MSENQKYTHEVVVLPVSSGEQTMNAQFLNKEDAHSCAEHFVDAKRLVIKGAITNPRSFIETNQELFLFVGVRVIGDTRNETLEVLKGDKSMLNAAIQESARQPIAVVDLSDIPQAVAGGELLTPLSYPTRISQESKADQEMRS